MDEKKDKPEVHITEGLNADEIDRWIQGNIDGSNQTALIPLSGQVRNEIAEEILRYIEFHTESAVNTNSLKVLRDLFA